MEDRNNPENQALATMQGIQASMWDIIAEDADGDGIQNPFAPDPEEEAKRRKLALHKAWLESLPRECVWIMDCCLRPNCSDSCMMTRVI